VSLPYALGLPVWALPAWRGRLFTKRAKPAEFLEQYAQVFNTVEGNTTFYQVPSAETVERWGAVTPPSFRFAFKFPREVTHVHALRGAALDEARDFLDVVAPLGPRLGQFLLQLPATFAPMHLRDLDAFLTALEGPPLAVEVRHPAFFGGWAEGELHGLLRAHRVDRALMDTRALRAAPADDAFSVAARERKPDVPVQPVRVGTAPFARIVTHLDRSVTWPYLEQWAQVIVGWIQAGCHPWVFAHSPGDVWCPEVARALHELIRRQVPMPPLPQWPGEREQTQLALF
jgi:uncharacterized protein YecE (DUF72 family)